MCGHAQPPGREGSPYTAPCCLSLIGHLWHSVIPSRERAFHGRWGLHSHPGIGQIPLGHRKSQSLSLASGRAQGAQLPWVACSVPDVGAGFPLEGTSFCGGLGGGTLHLPDLRPTAWALALGLICHRSLWHTVPILQGRPFRALGGPQQVAPGEKHLPFPSALIPSVGRARPMGQGVWTPGGL